MDLEGQFRQVVEETIRACRERGKPEQTWGYPGEAVTGWAVESNYFDRGEAGFRYDGWITLIMATDGSLWRHERASKWWEDDGTQENVDEVSLVSNETIVGRKGKPFAEMTQKIERLPYL